MRASERATTSDPQVNPFHLSEVVRLLQRLLHGNRGYALTLFGLALLASVAEGFGFSLTFPLLQNLLGSERPADGGILQSGLNALTNVFPPDWRLEGILGLLVALFFVKSVALLAVTAVTRWFINSLRLQWITAAFTAFVGAPYARVAGLPQGEVIQTITGETQTAAHGVVILVELMARTVQVVVLIGVLLLADWRVTAAMSAVGLLLFALVWKKTRNLSLSSGITLVQIRQRTTDVVSESLAALRTVKLLDMTGATSEKLAENLRKYRRVDMTFNVISSLPSRVIDVVAAVFGTITILFMTRILGMDISVVIPMTALFGLVFLRLMSAIAYLFSRRMNLATSIPSLRAVYDVVVTSPEQEPTGEAFPGFRGDIVFEDIRLRPPGRDTVFLGLTMHIATPGMTAIVGPSGSGKTTLVDLLVRLREPDSGRITVAGRDIRQFDVRSIRKRVGYLSQDPQLFNGTVAENLRLGRPDATDRELIAATVRAHAHAFIMAMPDGYETPLGRGAVTLSGGQRQRLALAREVLRNPDLYIFDEPTSALDREAEAAISELMHELSLTHPVIVIAHRPDVVTKAQKIYRLQSGKAMPVQLADIAQPLPQDRAEG